MSEPAASSGAKPRGKRKATRPKHVPQRTCVACRGKSAKRVLIRIVKTPEGEVLVDPSRRANGRGAYLCEDPACWQRALNSNVLEHALKMTFDSSAIARLREFAETNLESAARESAQSKGDINT